MISESKILILFLSKKETAPGLGDKDLILLCISIDDLVQSIIKSLENNFLA